MPQRWRKDLQGVEPGPSYVEKLMIVLPDKVGQVTVQEKMLCCFQVLSVTSVALGSNRYLEIIISGQYIMKDPP